MSSNSVMPIVNHEEVFSRVPKSESITYSTFNRDHRHLTAIDASYLYPILIDEVYPGDVFQLTGRHLNRLLTSVKPFYDNLIARYFFFYVPNRITWHNWKYFMGERKRNTELSAVLNTYMVPTLNTGDGVEPGSIFDYAGIPVNVPNLEFNALPFRAINLIYNEFFRDENVGTWLQVGGTGDTEEELEESEFGDSDNIDNYKLFRICKRHDYFTSGLPSQTLGAPAVMSIGDKVSVTGNGYPLGVTRTGDVGNQLFMTFRDDGGQQGFFPGTGNYSILPTTFNATTYSNDTGVGVTTNPEYSGLVADLSNVTGFSLSDFRTLMQIEALKELNMRMGHRYKEIIYGEFDVVVSDATLDRPEFLGSYQSVFNIVPVASTAETANNPQGNLAAFGYTSNAPHYGFTKGFEEHGYVIGLVAVQTDQSYQQGLNRMWSRKEKYDYYTPLLANISEQAIKMKELFAQGASVLDANGDPVDEKTFNFQEAFAELRFKPNLITGKMRSGVDGTLDVWHLGTEFSPTIVDDVNLGIPFNEEFLQDNTRENLERVLAVQGEPQIESDNFFNYLCTRELPIYSVPSYLLGRL